MKINKKLLLFFLAIISVINIGAQVQAGHVHHVNTDGCESKGQPCDCIGFHKGKCDTGSNNTTGGLYCQC